MIITFAATKGGVGKTTLSMIVAETMSRARPSEPVLLLDLDPQGSATAYADRTSDLLTEVRPIVARSAGVLPRQIREAVRGRDLVVIDTPPGQLDVIDAALSESDLVVIPAQAFIDPVMRAVETVAMAKGLAPAVVVLNQVRAGAQDAGAARNVLEAQGVRVLDVVVPEWVAIGRIDGSGWPTDQRLLTLFAVVVEQVLKEVAR